MLRPDIALADRIRRAGTGRRTGRIVVERERGHGHADEQVDRTRDFQKHHRIKPADQQRRPGAGRAGEARAGIPGRSGRAVPATRPSGRFIRRTVSPRCAIRAELYSCSRARCVYSPPTVLLLRFDHQVHSAADPAVSEPCRRIFKREPVRWKRQNRRERSGITAARSAGETSATRAYGTHTAKRCDGACRQERHDETL